MEFRHFLNVMAIANNPAEYADSLVLVYTDTCDVFGPYFGETEQLQRYAKAVQTGRPFTFKTWAHKG